MALVARGARDPVGFVALRWHLALAVGVCAMQACASGYYGPPPEPYALPPIGAQIVGNGGACVGSEGGGDANGTPVILFHCDGMTGQRWVVKGGHIARSTGSCLDVQGSAATDGAPIILVQCYGGSSQQWSLSNGQIVGIGDMCIASAGGASADHTPLILASCAVTPGQLWTVQ